MFSASRVALTPAQRVEAAIHQRSSHQGVKIVEAAAQPDFTSLIGSVERGYACIPTNEYTSHPGSLGARSLPLKEPAKVGETLSPSPFPPSVLQHSRRVIELISAAKLYRPSATQSRL